MFKQVSLKSVFVAFLMSLMAGFSAMPLHANEILPIMPDPDTTCEGSPLGIPQAVEIDDSEFSFQNAFDEPSDPPYSSELIKKLEGNLAILEEYIVKPYDGVIKELNRMEAAVSRKPPSDKRDTLLNMIDDVRRGVNYFRYSNVGRFYELISIMKEGGPVELSELNDLTKVLPGLTKRSADMDAAFINLCPKDAKEE